jgi:hypothetical protein
MQSKQARKGRDAMEAEVLIALIGVVIASIALIFAAIQVYLNRQQLRLNTEQLHKNTEVNRGNIWLKLEEMSRHYEDVHLKLRPGGDWAGQDEQGGYKRPEENHEWTHIEDYMGFLEHFEDHAQQGG